MRYSMKLPLILLLISLPASALITPIEIGQYKGAVKLGLEISSRIYQEPYRFDAGQYLNGDRQLRHLLGGYGRVGTINEYQNGNPNALNLMLYHLVFSRFASELVEECGTPKLPLSNEFRSQLTVVCEWPSPTARNEAILYEFWRTLVGFEFPEEEFLHWQNFIHREFSETKADLAIPQILLAVFMNPYFLLEH